MKKRIKRLFATCLVFTFVLGMFMPMKAFATNWNANNIKIYELGGDERKISDYSADYVGLFYGNMDNHNTKAMMSLAITAIQKGTAIRPILMDMDSSDDALAGYALKYPNVTVSHNVDDYKSQLKQFSGNNVTPTVVIYDRNTKEEVYKQNGYDLKSLKEFLESIESSNTNNIAVPLELIYHQTEAREQIQMLNEFRTGDHAWYWNSDDTTKTECNNLSALSYDYKLERVAKQRAVEIALYYSHDRADEKDWSQTYEDCGYVCSGAKGENIAYGYSSSSAVFEAWKEEAEAYSGQGHRRNMLNSNFTVCAFACVEYEGRKYWVQEFAAPSSDGGTNAVIAAQDESDFGYVSIKEDFVDGFYCDDFTLKVGESIFEKDKPIYLSYKKDGVTVKKSIYVNPNGVTEHMGPDGVIDLDDDVIYAKEVGTARWETTFTLPTMEAVTVITTIHVVENAADKSASEDDASNAGGQNGNPQGDNSSKGDNSQIGGSLGATALDTNAPASQTDVGASSSENKGVSSETVITNSDGTATVTEIKSKKKKITIGDTVTVNGVDYKVTELGKGALKNCKKATSVTLPNSLKKIHKGAFKGAKNLKEIKLNVKKSIVVQKGAFSGVDTKKLTIKVNKKMSAKELKKFQKTLKKAGFKGKVKKAL